MDAFWAYVQAYPATALVAVGFAAIAGVLAYDNWAKLKTLWPGTTTTTPGGGKQMNQLEVLTSLVGSQAYFARNGCPEGVKACGDAIVHAAQHQPIVVVQSAPPPLNVNPPSSATITISGPGPLTASQAP